MIEFDRTSILLFSYIAEVDIVSVGLHEFHSFSLDSDK